MRISTEELNLKVVVRRVATGSTPFAWELHSGDSITPVHVSTERFRSLHAAYTAGQTGLADYVSQRRSAKPERSRARRIMDARHRSEPPDRDDLQEEEDCLEGDIAAQTVDGTDSTIAAN